jgi:hypothetical protein
MITLLELEEYNIYMPATEVRAETKTGLFTRPRYIRSAENALNGKGQDPEGMTLLTERRSLQQSFLPECGPTPAQYHALSGVISRGSDRFGGTAFDDLYNRYVRIQEELVHQPTALRRTA